MGTVPPDGPRLVRDPPVYGNCQHEPEGGYPVALTCPPMGHPFTSTGDRYHEMQIPDAVFRNSSCDGSRSIIARRRPGRSDISVPSGHHQLMFRCSQRSRPNIRVSVQPFLEAGRCMQIGDRNRGQAGPEQLVAALLCQEPDGLGQPARGAGSMLRGHTGNLLGRGFRAPCRTGLSLRELRKGQHGLLERGRGGPEIAPALRGAAGRWQGFEVRRSERSRF